MDWAKKTPKSRKLFFEPGSSFWLAHHNVSMAFRKVQRGHEGLSIWGIIGLIVITLVAIVPLAIFAFFSIKSGGSEINEKIANISSMVLLFFLVTGISTSLMATVENYTDRGDLDLLLTSPIRVENIVSARLYSAIWRDFTLYFMISLSVFILPIIFIDNKYLWFVPAIIGFSLFLLSCAFLLGQFILQAFGVRKGQKIVRIMGGVVSISWLLFLVFRRPITAKFLTEESNRALDFSGFTWFGRAFAGDFVPSITILLIGISMFVIARASSSKVFSQIAASIAGLDEAQQSSRIEFKSFRFKTLLPFSLFAKEWRVMRRDPLTYIQAFAPIVALLPGVMQGLQTPQGKFIFNPEIYPPVATIAAGQIVLALAWVAVSLEDANDLLIVSPQKPYKILLSKALAVMIPGFIIIAFFSVLCLFGSWWVAFVCFSFGTLSIFASALIEFLRPRPTKRVKLTQRPDRSMMSVFVSFGLSISWGLGAYFAAAQKSVWWIPTLIGLIVFAIAILSSPKLKKHGIRNSFLHY